MKTSLVFLKDVVMQMYCSNESSINDRISKIVDRRLAVENLELLILHHVMFLFHFKNSELELGECGLLFYP